jgi:hypothetical protein
MAAPPAAAPADAAGDEPLTPVLARAEPRGPRALVSRDPGAALALAAHCCMLDAGFQVGARGGGRLPGTGRARRCKAPVSTPAAAARRRPTRASPRLTSRPPSRPPPSPPRCTAPTPTRPRRPAPTRPAPAGSARCRTSGCSPTPTPARPAASCCTARCSARRGACWLPAWSRRRPATSRCGGRGARGLPVGRANPAASDQT